MEQRGWKAEVSGPEEQRWWGVGVALALIGFHLPAFVLQPSWPALIGAVLGLPSLRARSVARVAHWISLTVSSIGAAAVLLTLYVGSAQRRGLLPVVLALPGTWLVLLNPLYFLLAAYEYLPDREDRAEQDTVVLMLSDVGLLIVLTAALWNASFDRVFHHHLRGRRRSISTAEDAGGHVLVDDADLIRNSIEELDENELSVELSSGQELHSTTDYDPYVAPKKKPEVLRERPSSSDKRHPSPTSTVTRSPHISPAGAD